MLLVTQLHDGVGRHRPLSHPHVRRVCRVREDGPRRLLEVEIGAPFGEDERLDGRDHLAVLLPERTEDGHRAATGRRGGAAGLEGGPRRDNDLPIPDVVHLPAEDRGRPGVGECVVRHGQRVRAVVVEDHAEIPGGADGRVCRERHVAQNAAAAAVNRPGVGHADAVDERPAAVRTRPGKDKVVIVVTVPVEVKPRAVADLNRRILIAAAGLAIGAPVDHKPLLHNEGGRAGTGEIAIRPGQ